MNKFIVLIAPEKALTPANYPTLFGFFASIRNGVHFEQGVLAFEFRGDVEAANLAIHEHLTDADEAIVFEVCGGAWRLDRLKGGDKKDARLRKFLGMEKR